MIVLISLFWTRITVEFELNPQINKSSQLVSLIKISDEKACNLNSYHVN